jgi:TetR/AcrR family transcriptional regulator, transcriptional repressor for nem operon
MSSRGELTRQKILDATQEVILQQGYSQASVDRVLEKSGLTKGAFFYHFKSKNDLIKALIDRYASEETDVLVRSIARGEALARDPLQQLLVAVGIMIEEADVLAQSTAAGSHPGCLFGSYTYEIDTIVPEVHEVLRRTAIEWRTMVRGKLDEAAAEHPPCGAVDLDDLANGLLVAYEGGFIMGRMLNDPGQLARQLRNYRALLEFTFGTRK